MALTLGRGITLRGSPAGVGSMLFTIGGVASFAMLDDSAVEVTQGHLTLATATMVMPQRLGSMSDNGGVLADFLATLLGQTISCTDTSFSDLSAGAITTWAWDFGDGNTSTTRNPSHSYATYGDYVVALTVTTAGGKTSTAMLGIVVNPGGTYLVWDEGNWDQALWAP